MALTISFVASGAGYSTFATSASALSADQRFTAGTGSVANNALYLVCDSSQSPAVTAYVTAASFTQTVDGADIFKAQGQGSEIFTFSASQSFATPVKMASDQSQTLTFTITAIGAECALGTQTGTITLTLSSIALSGNAVRIFPETSSTVNITVTAVNTPSDSGDYICNAEARRLYVLGYV